MINIEPILSLPAFIVSFIIALIVIAVIADIIVKKQNKSPHDNGTLSHEQENNLQNYYITKRKVN